jgi:hypothetical protein
VQNLSEILADGFSRLELPYVSIAFSVYPLITCKFSVLSLFFTHTHQPTREEEEEEEEGGGQDPSDHTMMPLLNGCMEILFPILAAIIFGLD